MAQASPRVETGFGTCSAAPSGPVLMRGLWPVGFVLEGWHLTSPHQSTRVTGRGL